MMERTNTRDLDEANILFKPVFIEDDVQTMILKSEDDVDYDDDNDDDDDDDDLYSDIHSVTYLLDRRMALNCRNLCLTTFPGEN